MTIPRLVWFLFFIFFVILTCSAEVTEIPETDTQTEPSSKSSSQPSVSNENPLGEPPKVGIPDTIPSSFNSQSNNKFDQKPLAVHFLQKFSNWVRPVYEKWSRFKDFLAYPDHPNYGGGHLFDPQEIWDKWQEKGHHFLTGINGAVYGLAPMENHDYPFAYRGLESSKKAK